MKQKYNYSKELRNPFSFGEIDFEKPVVIKTMKFVFSGISRRVLRYRPPKGTRKTVLQIPTEDGAFIPCFLIEPENANENLPVIIYCHGGGFIGPVQEHMLQNAVYYSQNLNCRVFLPEYRLVPEYPFPIPLNDCYDVLLYINNNAREYRIDMDKLIVYGDSAGGCLAAGITHLARDRNGPRAKGQMLIYPVTDNSMKQKSIEEYKDSVWSKSANRHMWNLYLKNGYQGLRKYAVPLKSDNFKDLPPAYVEPCEMDTLRDEGIEYAQKLIEAGIPTELNVTKGAYHGFDEDYSSNLVKNVLLHRCEVIKKMLNY